MERQQDTFTDYVLDQLSGVPEVYCRPMFGGFGLYQGILFFGIINKGRLYFKATTDTVILYKAHGMRPFRPNRKQALKSYAEVPPDVLDDPETLCTWADLSIRAAQELRSRRRPRRVRT